MLLRIELLHVTPLVWRRVRVPVRWTLRRVHDVIQVAFGWEDRHLHDYQMRGVRVGMLEPEEEREGLQDEEEWTLDDVLNVGSREFSYVYDVGDRWECRIVVEPESPTEAGRLLAPLCLAGENAAPPEDVGGPPGYAEFLTALADPEHDGTTNC